MSISPLEFPSLSSTGITNLISTGLAPAEAPAATNELRATQAADGADFGALVLDGLDRLEGLTDKADSLAVQAATGKLENIHDYTIAASEASAASQLTVALRNKAVEAFTSIMQMQV